MRRTFFYAAIGGLILISMTGCDDDRIPSAGCVADKEISYVCGLDDAEDLYHIPNTPWVITSSMGDHSWQGGGLYLVDSRNDHVSKVLPSFSAPAAQQLMGDKNCPGPPEKSLFSAHGITLRHGSSTHHQLYVVNHGGRESVEIFHVDAGGKIPELSWAGCVVLPSTAYGNAIAVLPEGGFVVTSIVDLSDQQAREKLLAGKNTGTAYEWNSKEGWKVVPGSLLSGNNGIAASSDGRWLYIVGWADASLTRIARHQEGVQPQRVRFDFLPDNIKWTPQGTLLVAGQAAGVEDVLNYVNGTQEVCSLDYAIAEVDPETLVSSTLIQHPGTANFGGATSAIQIGNSIWVGTFRGNRIARFSLPNQLYD